MWLHARLEPSHPIRLSQLQQLGDARAPTLSEFPSTPSSLWFPLRARLPRADIFQLLARHCSPCLPSFAGLSWGMLHPSIPVSVQPCSVPAPPLFLHEPSNIHGPAW